MPVGFHEDTKEAFFRTDGDGQETCKGMPLRHWLVQLEQAGADIQALDFACHSVKPGTEKDAAGDAKARVFKVEKKNECVFVPTPTPRKVGSTKPPTWEDAGSLVICNLQTIYMNFWLAPVSHSLLFCAPGYLQLANNIYEFLAGP